MWRRTSFSSSPGASSCWIAKSAEVTEHAPASTPASGLGGALGLLTVVGGGREMQVGAVAWFPVVGAALGAGLGAAWWALGRVLPPLVAGGLVVAADLAVTGMLHADGLT